MKVWITAYALTKGIIVSDRADRCSTLSTRGLNTVAVPWSGGMNGEALFHKPDWHTSEADAKARVQQMIAAKRASIEKTLRKLDKLEKELGS